MSEDVTVQDDQDYGPKGNTRGGPMQNIHSDGAIHRVPRMTREEYSGFIIHCAVCGDPLPEHRARARRETCGKRECGIKLKQFRKMTIEVRKCPTCYHPSTPEEREDFKQWRKERGQIQRRRGNPHGRKPKTALELLEATLPFLETLKVMVDNQEPSGDPKHAKEISAFIAEVEKVFSQS